MRPTVFCLPEAATRSARTSAPCARPSAGSASPSPKSGSTRRRKSRSPPTSNARWTRGARSAPRRSSVLWKAFRTI
ncbi:UNVERIFIED_CONTAM: hypothetical protein GTU68_000655 [Idotea baltica]|nr:hypothetical protein [Idotea baltica]